MLSGETANGAAGCQHNLTRCALTSTSLCSFLSLKLKQPMQCMDIHSSTNLCRRSPCPGVSCDGSHCNKRGDGNEQRTELQLYTQVQPASECGGGRALSLYIQCTSSGWCPCFGFDVHVTITSLIAHSFIMLQVAAALVKNAIDIRPGMLIVFSESGKLARATSKYRPCCPVLVVTSNAQLAARCSGRFSLYVMLLEKPLTNRAAIFVALKDALRFGVAEGLCVPGKEVVVLASTAATTDEKHMAERELFVTVAPGTLQFEKLGSLAPHVETPSSQDVAFLSKTISLRSGNISLESILRKNTVPRKTKIIVTAGPSCAKPGIMAAMVAAGVRAPALSAGSALIKAQLASSPSRYCDRQSHGQGIVCGMQVLTCCGSILHMLKQTRAGEMMSLKHTGKPARQAPANPASVLTFLELKHVHQSLWWTRRPGLQSLIYRLIKVTT
jgi:Pyruvate kinase, alpha/beta domain